MSASGKVESEPSRITVWVLFSLYLLLLKESCMTVSFIGRNLKLLTVEKQCFKNHIVILKYIIFYLYNENFINSCHLLKKIRCMYVLFSNIKLERYLNYFMDRHFRKNHKWSRKVNKPEYYVKCDTDTIE